MMKWTIHTASHEATGQLNQLMRDYINGAPALNDFYTYRPDLAGLSQALSQLQWPNSHREITARALAQQATLTDNTSERSLQNIEAIKSPNTFTVTTGHQLCVFSGPVFFIYKIASVIHLCKQLQEKHPDKNIVPVFWMATEDHDLEEANHFYCADKKYVWNTTQTGAVGRMLTAGLEEILKQLSEDWADSSMDEWLKALFQKAYCTHQTMADATRYLVNALFGHEGIVVLDGDDAALKALLVPVMEKDLLEGIPFASVDTSVRALEKNGYTAQVKPRPSNFFLLKLQQRLRIDKVDDGFVLQDQSETFSMEAIKKLIQAQPEIFSPNVLLRPVYQQIILPNLAYIGGPGELAYWLEFKAMFEALLVPFPVLVPRAFITVVPERIAGRIKKMNLTLADGFKSISSLLLQIQQKAGHEINLNQEIGEALQVFDRMKQLAEQTDTTLLAHLEARAVQLKKQMHGIEYKLNKAIRRRMETERNWLNQVHVCFMPNENIQERHLNFSHFVREYGHDWIKNIIDNANPLNPVHYFVEVGL